jgi:SAM-dependent methyltransferase
MKEGKRAGYSVGASEPLTNAAIAIMLRKSVNTIINYKKGKGLNEEIANRLIRCFFKHDEAGNQDYNILRTALDKEIRKHSVAKLSVFHELKSAQLFWNHILTEINYSFGEDRQIYSRSIEGAAHHISSIANMPYETAKSIASDARSKLFNTKYGKKIDSPDEREVDGNDWLKEITFVSQFMGVPEIGQLSCICVGIGSKPEGVGFYDKFKEFFAFDIAAGAVEIATKHFRNVNVGEAEDLPTTLTFDVYYCLKTYQSSYFGIERALSEAWRVLKPNGTAIVSVSHLYLSKDETITRGLSRTNYNPNYAARNEGYSEPDPMYVLDLISGISSLALAAGFSDLKFISGAAEHYIGFKKPRCDMNGRFD